MADTDLLTFDPLFPEEDEDTILTRWRDWANEGLDPEEDVDEWTDTREGSHWYVGTTPPRREAARMYDLMGTEVVAASFPQWAWGEYLDDHGELRNLGRLSATAAGGIVTFSGDEGTVVAAGTVVGVEPPDPDTPAPEYVVAETGIIPAPVIPATEGVIDLPVQAAEPGSLGNVSGGAVTALITPTPGVAEVTNADPIVGGTDPEADAPFRDRILESFVGAAVANLYYYRRISLDEPGVGRVTVVPVWDGPGTILVIISTAEGDPVAPGVVDSLQQRLDPVPGQGAGEGQVGATITVETASSMDVTLDATVELDPGYTLAGAGGTVPMQDAIDATVAAYVDSVQPGGEVVLNQVVARIMALRGVHDIGDVLLNGVAVNVAIPADPPQVPTLVTPSTLTEGAVP